MHVSMNYIANPFYGTSKTTLFIHLFLDYREMSPNSEQIKIDLLTLTIAFEFWKAAKEFKAISPMLSCDQQQDAVEPTTTEQSSTGHKDTSQSNSTATTKKNPPKRRRSERIFATNNKKAKLDRIQVKKAGDSPEKSVLPSTNEAQTNNGAVMSNGMALVFSVKKKEQPLHKFSRRLDSSMSSRRGRRDNRPKQGKGIPRASCPHCSKDFAKTYIYIHIRRMHPSEER